MVFNCVLLHTTSKCFSRIFVKMKKKKNPTPSLCKRIIFESAPASERRKPYVLAEGSVFWISAPRWAPFCSTQKVSLYVESSLRCSLTKTVWVLSTFGRFGPSIGRVPSVYVRQRICIPKTLVSIVHLPNEGVGLDSFFLPLKKYVFWLYSREVKSMGFGVRLLEFEFWLYV